MKKIYFIFIFFACALPITRAQTVFVDLADWAVADQYLKNGYIKYESPEGETPFVYSVIFHRFNTSVSVQVQAVLVIKENNGSEIAISDSLFINTADFTGNVWTPIKEKNAKLLPNHKFGSVQLKWRFFDTYAGESDPQWSTYSYSGKTYNTIRVSSSVPPEVISPYEGATAIYRMYNFDSNLHMLASRYSEVTNLILNHGWINDYMLGFLYKEARTNTVPLYRYYNSSNGDHYYTTIATTPSGYVKEEIFGYIYTAQVANSIPLYGYYGTAGHIVTRDWDELGNGKNGYQYEGIIGYVLP